MSIDQGSTRQPISLRYAVVALVAVVAGAAVFLGVSLISSPTLPIVAASYKCVPGGLIPQMKPGQSSTITTSYGGFTATFQATEPAHTPANGLVAGMPFKGVLTLSGGGQSWTLPGPANPASSQINAMCVIAFQRTQHPGVMIEGFTGGAHCCEVPVIYRYNGPNSGYVKVVDMSPFHFKDPHAFDPNGGFIPKVVGNQVLLTTSDGDFAYAFGCYACSTDPIALDSVGPDGLTDVTPKQPSLVAADAGSIWTAALKALQSEATSTAYSPFGLLAPWVADECVLRKGASAWSMIEQLQRAGKLSNASYDQWTTNHDSYLADLHLFLLRHDYCNGQI